MAQWLLLLPPPVQADQEGSLRRSQTPATPLEEGRSLLTLPGLDPCSLLGLWGSGPSKARLLTPGIEASPPSSEMSPRLGFRPGSVFLPSRQSWVVG